MATTIHLITFTVPDTISHMNTAVPLMVFMVPCTSDPLVTTTVPNMTITVPLMVSTVTDLQSLMAHDFHSPQHLTIFAVPNISQFLQSLTSKGFHSP